MGETHKKAKFPDKCQFTRQTAPGTTKAAAGQKSNFFSIMTSNKGSQLLIRESNRATRAMKTYEMQGSNHVRDVFKTKAEPSPTKQSRAQALEKLHGGSGAKSSLQYSTAFKTDLKPILQQVYKKEYGDPVKAQKARHPYKPHIYQNPRPPTCVKN